MKVLVVGGGGREHAIIKKLKESKEISHLYCAPGNGLIASDAICVPLQATDVSGIAAWATENQIDYAVVAPDDPLCLGLVDLLKEKGVPAFGPDKNAAIIEGSKAFSKRLMKKYHIPTADFEVFSDCDAALKHLENRALPVVVKADGLALGKGVLICETLSEAREAVIGMMRGGRFGASGRSVVIEDFLTGPEVSLLCFTDGESVAPMPASMDHKRALTGDRGLNTGGMGAITPNPYYTPEVERDCMQSIVLPTLAAMRQEGRRFRGCLYFGLMITKQGARVIEYNCRFGDPEAQAVLPLLESDLLTVMRATTNGTLADTEVAFRRGASCNVVVASGGYPGEYKKGCEITGLALAGAQAAVYGAGVTLQDGKYLTSGGRVLSVTALGDTLPLAIRGAYQAARSVRFEGAYIREDIGLSAIKAQSK